jgi:2-methylisocitrate lyase-like PEP mutase family enzyme
MTTARPAHPALRARFRELHAAGTFVMPNPWDVGSATMLAGLGFPALATTSSGYAATLGRADQQVTRDELLGHVAALVAGVDVPISVDAEHGFGADPAGIGETYRLIGGTGAAGASIEDYDPTADRILDAGAAVERVGAAAEAAHAVGMVLTARAEQHLHDRDADLDDTIARLIAYRDAGADVVYAPGLRALTDIERVVKAVDVPVNVLRMPGTPPLADLAAAGVRRISTGGALARIAYVAATEAARALLDPPLLGTAP